MYFTLDPHPKSMKRSRSSGGGNEWEIRNNKVQKKMALPAVLIEALAKTDVWPYIAGMQRWIHWTEKWYSGHLQIFRCQFDNDDIICSKWNMCGQSLRFFNAWWGFLSEVKRLKAEMGIWCQLTIASSSYWQKNADKVHRFESFHLGAKSTDPNTYDEGNHEINEERDHEVFGYPNDGAGQLEISDSEDCSGEAIQDTLDLLSRLS